MWKYAVLFIVLMFGTSAFAKPKPPAHSPPQIQCVALMDSLNKIHAAMPINKAMAVGPEMGNPLRNWVGQMPPVDKTPYDLVIIIAHTDGQYGVVVGWRKDPKLDNHASACVSVLVGPKLAPMFEKLTGLKPSDNPPKPKDDGSV